MAGQTVLVGTVTQGGADAFAEAEIQTGLQGIGTRAWAIAQIQIERPQLPPANGCNIEIALSRGSKSSMPTITDRDLILKLAYGIGFTTSGAFLEEKILTFTPSEQILLVEDPVYFLIDSALTSVANTALIAITVTEKKISEVDRLSIIASRLSS